VIKRSIGVGFGVVLVGVFRIHALSVEPYSLAPYPEIAKLVKPTIGSYSKPE
jgi:hypothetical protein